MAGNPHQCHLPACHQAVSAPMLATSALVAGAALPPLPEGGLLGLGKIPALPGYTSAEYLLRLLFSP